MHVVHIFKNYFPPTPGGVEHHINGIVHSLEGIEFTVLTASASRSTEIDNDRGVRVIRSGTLVKASTAPVVPGWGPWLRRLDPDVIHLHMPNPWAEIATLRARPRTAVVATFHAEIVRAPWLLPAYRVMLRRLFARVDHIVVGSPRLLATAEELSTVRDRAVVIPYGVDPEAWAVRPGAADEIKSRFGGGPIVLFLARVRHYKGLHVLIEAMRDVDDAKLIVAGDGPSAGAARAAAADAGLDHRVHFLGEISNEERAAYYHAADVFVLPSVSRGESFGIALLEAMACGTPVVSTELGTGTSWVNEHGSTGLVVPPDDAPALASALQSLLADDARRAAMGAAGTERVRRHFTSDQMLSALRDLYVGAAQAR